MKVHVLVSSYDGEISLTVYSDYSNGVADFIKLLNAEVKIPENFDYTSPFTDIIDGVFLDYSPESYFSGPDYIVTYQTHEIQ